MISEITYEIKVSKFIFLLLPVWYLQEKLNIKPEKPYFPKWAYKLEGPIKCH